MRAARDTEGGALRLPGEHARAAADPGADRFRAPDIRYLTQIAQAAEHMGFDTILTPTGTWCEDAWLTCAVLTQETERLRAPGTCLGAQQH
ncbi:MAG: LLM class flavin-dependent oxidoreductase [Pseudonocardiales bacterium]